MARGGRDRGWTGIGKGLDPFYGTVNLHRAIPGEKGRTGRAERPHLPAAMRWGVRGSLLCPRHLHAHGLEQGNAGAVILPFTPSPLSFPLWMRPWERFAPRVAVRSRCRQCVCGCVRRGRSRRVGELRRASSQETRPFSSRLL